MGKRWDVLGLGAVAVDDILCVDHYPPVDSKEPVLSWERQAGGLAGTALVTVVRLGGNSAYLGVLGKDDLSVFTMNEFQKEGVDTSLIQIREEARPIHSMVIVERRTGSRTLFFDSSGFQEAPLARMEKETLKNCQVLFVDYTVKETGVWAGQVANDLGIPVVADIERGEFNELRSLLKVTNHLVIGKQMAQQLSGKEKLDDSVYELQKHGFSAVVVTAGDQGCWFAAQGEDVTHLPAIEVPVVDTVGCGDVFHGAYAYSLSKGSTIAQAVQIANVTAGLKARKPGGRTGIPAWCEVEEYLHTYKIAGCT